MTVQPIDILQAPQAVTVYDSPAFVQLNAARAQRVATFGLVDDNGRVLAAQTLGLRGGEWCAPFSAPFSAPCVAQGVDATVAVPQLYSRLPQAVGAPVRITLPPEAYGAYPLPHNARVEYAEYNYHYPMAQAAEYVQFLSHAGRKNHRRTMEYGFGFEHTPDTARAYAVIEANRRAMGYPLAMSLDQVLQTTSCAVDADCFVLTLDGVDVAAAIVFSVTPQTVQVIYWGDHPEARQTRCMNALAWHVMQWYAQNRPCITMVDIGPASVHGVLNEGLARFKTSFGCVLTMRPTVRLEAL